MVAHRFFGTFSGLVLALTAMAATPGQAQEDGLASRPAEPASSGRRGEMLFALPPEDWVLVSQNKDGAIYQPPAAAGGGKAWTQRVEVEITRDNHLPVRNKINALQAKGGPGCDGYNAPVPTVQLENGYETAIFVEECRSPKVAPKVAAGQPEPLIVTMHKIIRGKDNLYRVSRTWRGYDGGTDNPLQVPEVAVKWELFLNKVEVCDFRQPNIYCASVGLASPQLAEAIANQAGWQPFHGCRYLAVATLLPDLQKPMGSVRYAAVTFGAEPFGDRPDEKVLLEELGSAGANNRPIALVTRVYGVDTAEFADDRTINDQNLGRIYDFFAARKLADSRWLVRRFYDCGQ